MSPVKSLSGGERNRLLLARLFAKPANVLVLDEPTNDLDIETLELLEELIGDFDGTVLLVSHDRAFLDNIVTSTLAFEGEGRVVEYVGGYEDYLRQSMPVLERPRTEHRRTEYPNTEHRVPNPGTGKRKLSYNETRELEAVAGTNRGARDRNRSPARGGRVGGFLQGRRRTNPRCARPHRSCQQRTRNHPGTLD